MAWGSKIKIKPAHVGYTLMGRSRKYYGSIKIFSSILIIILILLYEIQQLISNIRLLNGMHDLPCLTFKLFYYDVGWGAT